MKYEIDLSDEEVDKIVRKELIRFLRTTMNKDLPMIGEDHIDTPILIGALIRVIQAYTPPQKHGKLAESIKKWKQS